MLCCRKYRYKHLNDRIVKFPSDGFPKGIQNIINPVDNVKIDTMERISPITSDDNSNKSDGRTKENEIGGRKRFGEYTYKNGDVYRGYWVDDLRHGKGMLIKHSGDSYEGDWERGIRNGYGIERFTNGTVYMGNFVNGIRYGYGEIQMKDKSIYEGTFDDGITGHGRIVWPNGEEYVGDVLDGYKHGYGTTVYNGKKVNGYYQNGHRIV